MNTNNQQSIQQAKPPHLNLDTENSSQICNISSEQKKQLPQKVFDITFPFGSLKAEMQNYPIHFFKDTKLKIKPEQVSNVALRQASKKKLRLYFTPTCKGSRRSSSSSSSKQATSNLLSQIQGQSIIRKQLLKQIQCNENAFFTLNESTISLTSGEKNEPLQKDNLQLDNTPFYRKNNYSQCQQSFISLQNSYLQHNNNSFTLYGNSNGSRSNKNELFNSSTNNPNGRAKSNNLNANNCSNNGNVGNITNNITNNNNNNINILQIPNNQSNINSLVCCNCSNKAYNINCAATKTEENALNDDSTQYNAQFLERLSKNNYLLKGKRVKLEQNTPYQFQRQTKNSFSSAYNDFYLNNSANNSYLTRTTYSDSQSSFKSGTKFSVVKGTNVKDKFLTFYQSNLKKDEIEAKEKCSHNSNQPKDNYITITGNDTSIDEDIIKQVSDKLEPDKLLLTYAMKSARNKEPPTNKIEDRIKTKKSAIQQILEQQKNIQQKCNNTNELQSQIKHQQLYKHIINNSPRKQKCVPVNQFKYPDSLSASPKKKFFGGIHGTKIKSQYKQDQFKSPQNFDQFESRNNSNKSKFKSYYSFYQRKQWINNFYKQKQLYPLKTAQNKKLQEWHFGAQDIAYGPWQQEYQQEEDFALENKL